MANTGYFNNMGYGNIGYGNINMGYGYGNGSYNYNNGNFYHLEKDNVLGYKKYHKYFDGSEYINVVEKK